VVSRLTRHPSFRRRFGGGVEFLLLSACFLVTDAFVWGYPAWTHQGVVADAMLHALLLQVCMYYAGLYEDSALRGGLEGALRLAQTLAFGTLIFTLAYFFFTDLNRGRKILGVYLPLSFVLLVLWRSVYAWTLGREALSDSVLIVGTGHSAQQVAREMLQSAPLGFRVVGFLGEHRAEVGRQLVQPSVIGTMEDLLPLVAQLRVDLIVMALDDRRGKMPVGDLLQCRVAGVRVEDATSFFERLTGKILVRNLRPSFLVFSQGFNKPRLLLSSKRAAEFLLALVAMVLAAPVLAVVALLVKLDSRGPVFYGQERVGEKGRSFTLLKFRTMRADAEAATGPVWATGSDDRRTTRVGRYLRTLRLDELPQLLNVLTGDMSFVGPRPERPHFVQKLSKIIPYYDERHSVKPGITGWAQVKYGYGSNIEDTEEKLQYDLYYIKNMSLRFDVGIMIDTLKVMVTGRGAR
jgi:sugar transferase (PEP-CTERM system associated)